MDCPHGTFLMSLGNHWLWEGLNPEDELCPQSSNCPHERRRRNSSLGTFFNLSEEERWALVTAGMISEKSRGARKHTVPFALTEPTTSRPHSFLLPHSPWGPRPREWSLGELIRIAVWRVQQGAWPGLFLGARPWDPFPISCLRYAEQAQAFLLGGGSWTQANNSQKLSHLVSFLPQLSILLGPQIGAPVSQFVCWKPQDSKLKVPLTKPHKPSSTGLVSPRQVISCPFTSRANIYCSKMTLLHLQGPRWNKSVTYREHGITQPRIPYILSYYVPDDRKPPNNTFYINALNSRTSLKLHSFGLICIIIEIITMMFTYIVALPSTVQFTKHRHYFEPHHPYIIWFGFVYLSPFHTSAKRMQMTCPKSYNV